MRFFSKYGIGILLFLANNFAFAWDHSIEMGYGYSHDPNSIKYNNSGVFLNGDLVSLKHYPRAFLSINAAIGQWHTTAPHNKDLTTGALSLALRLYPFKIQNNPFYFLGSAGPAVLSNRKFGVNTQAKNVAIQSILGIGMEFKHIDANFHLVHYSNANLASPNGGFNILYMLSMGYLF